MAGHYDLTFPMEPHTGKERSRRKLSQPDERTLRYGLDAEDVQAPFLKLEARLTETVPEIIRQRLEVARNLAAYGYFCYEFYAVSLFWSVSCIEMALRCKFVECHGDHISLRKGRNGREEACEVPLSELRSRRRQGWRVAGMKWFDDSFRALLVWALKTRILPKDIPIPLQEIFHHANDRFLYETFFKRGVKDGLIDRKNATIGGLQMCWGKLSEKQRRHYSPKPADAIIEELPRLRNDIAHPWINMVLPPRSAVGAYDLATDILRRLWPDLPARSPGDTKANPESATTEKKNRQSRRTKKSTWIGKNTSSIPSSVMSCQGDGVYKGGPPSEFSQPRWENLVVAGINEVGWFGGKSFRSPYC